MTHRKTQGTEVGEDWPETDANWCRIRRDIRPAATNTAQDADFTRLLIVFSRDAFLRGRVQFPLNTPPEMLAKAGDGSRYRPSTCSSTALMISIISGSRR